MFAAEYHSVGLDRREMLVIFLLSGPPHLGGGRTYRKRNTEILSLADLIKGPRYSPGKSGKLSLPPALLASNLVLGVAAKALLGRASFPTPARCFGCQQAH